jgi:phenylpropionate dioxygenase-like ring-hydroxylating dioxygenase large terminal subunit
VSAVPNIESEISTMPVKIPVEAYISEQYAREEKEKLWLRVWQVACREEEIPNVGDFYTYDILDQSLIIVRTAPDTIMAHHNVCMHRGRRLTEGCSQAKRFFCKFHGWQWHINGENAKVLDREDWGSALTQDNLRLRSAKVGRWGGYVFVNLDPNCESLEKFLEPVPAWLNAFELDKMRYRWRQWLHFPCNWKIALEAFIETYHVTGTHPQLLRFGWSKTWSRAQGKHAWHGLGIPGDNRAGGGTTSISSKAGVDPRKLAAEYMEHLYSTVNANTTQTIVDAAKTLVDVLPENTPSDVVMAKMMQLAQEADAKRGVQWPSIEPKLFEESGIDWHVFPNTIILHGVSFMLGYRARPNGFNPDSCIFEVYVMERFPEGEEPKPENIYQPDQSEERWRLVLSQDFANMSEVQKGVKSTAFPGTRPNPVQEQAVINFHKTLAQYMGTGAPQPIE